MHVISQSGPSGPLGLGRREKVFITMAKHMSEMPVRQVCVTHWCEVSFM